MNDLTITEILSQIQSELKAPKGQFNQFGQYKYRSCEDILEALKPVLAKYKAVVNLSDEIVLIGDRIYVKATATLFCGNAEMSTVAYAREDERKKGMDGSQITGSASSYARKYALNGLFAIDDTKDADATNDHGKDQNDSGKPPVGIVCGMCGNKITETQNRDGTLWTVFDIRDYSIKRFGKSLCPTCMKQAQKAEKEAENHSNSPDGLIHDAANN